MNISSSVAPTIRTMMIAASTGGHWLGRSSQRPTVDRATPISRAMTARLIS